VNTREVQVERDDISLHELVTDIWKLKYYLMVLVTIFGLVSITYSLRLPNSYKSEVVLFPVQNQGIGGLSSAMSGQLGGLASLAGFSVGTKDTKSVLALQVLGSRSFFESLCRKYDMLIPLMAGKTWDQHSRKLVIDDEIYDEKDRQWVRKVNAPLLPEPSMQEAFEVFKKLITIEQDKTTSVVKVSLEFISPDLVHQWLTAIVSELNTFMRDKDILEAEQSIEYLNKQTYATDLQEVRSILFQLVEEQTKTLMLANVRQDYVFQVVDPAKVPLLKSGPRRAVIVIFSCLVAAVLVVMFSVMRLVMGKGKSS